jgi:hypothetical protein
MPRECLTPQAETLRGSVTLPFPITRRDTSMILPSEIPQWLTTYGGLTPDRVPHIDAYVAHFLMKQAYNSAALEGQQRMKKAVTWAAKRTRTKASTTMVTANQLDREVAAARLPSPPPDPAASGQWSGSARPFDHVKSRSPSPVPELRLRNSLGFPSFPSLPIYITPYLIPTQSPLVLTSLPFVPAT